MDQVILHRVLVQEDHSFQVHRNSKWISPHTNPASEPRVTTTSEAPMDQTNPWLLLASLKELQTTNLYRVDLTQLLLSNLETQLAWWQIAPMPWSNPSSTTEVCTLIWTHHLPIWDWNKDFSPKPIRQGRSSCQSPQISRINWCRIPIMASLKWSLQTKFHPTSLTLEVPAWSVVNTYPNLVRLASQFNSKLNCQITKAWWSDNKCLAQWIPATTTWLEIRIQATPPTNTSSRCKLKFQEWRTPQVTTLEISLTRVQELRFLNSKAPPPNTLALSRT